MRWWAPRSTGMKLISCEIDLRVGGKYRYVFSRDGEKPVAFFGKYTLVERPTRLVWTDEDLLQGSGPISEPTAATGEAMSTLTLDEKQGKTKLALYSLFPSKEVLDAIAPGVEHDTREQLDQLEDLVARHLANFETGPQVSPQ